MNRNLITKSELSCSPIDKKYIEQMLTNRNDDRDEYRNLNKKLLDLKKYTKDEFNKLSNDPFYARAMQLDLMFHSHERMNKKK